MYCIIIRTSTVVSPVDRDWLQGEKCDFYIFQKLQKKTQFGVVPWSQRNNIPMVAPSLRTTYTNRKRKGKEEEGK